jgi:hypothetical protein
MVRERSEDTRLKATCCLRVRSQSRDQEHQQVSWQAINARDAANTSAGALVHVTLKLHSISTARDQPGVRCCLTTTGDGRRQDNSTSINLNAEKKETEDEMETVPSAGGLLAERWNTARPCETPQTQPPLNTACCSW